MSASGTGEISWIVTSNSKPTMRTATTGWSRTSITSPINSRTMRSTRFWRGFRLRVAASCSISAADRVLSRSLLPRRSARSPASRASTYRRRCWPSPDARQNVRAWPTASVSSRAMPRRSPSPTHRLTASSRSTPGATCPIRRPRPGRRFESCAQGAPSSSRSAAARR